MPEARSKVAKKTAVKAVKARAVPKKKVAKKTTAKKTRVTAKKAPTKPKAVAKKAVKKSTKHKVVPKKPAAKKPRKAVKNSAVKSTSSPKRKQLKKDTVELPVHMSIRAREKALVWAEEFEKKIHKPAYALTMTLGALFVMFGSYSGLSMDSSAEVACVDSGCAAQLISGSGLEETESVTQHAPGVELISDIPSEIYSNTVILVDTVNTQRLLAELVFTGAGGSMEVEQVPVENALNGRFRIAVPGDALDQNHYTLRVKLYDTQGGAYGYTTLGAFSVPGQSSGLVEQTTTNNDSEPPLVVPEEDSSTQNFFTQDTTEVEDEAVEEQEGEQIANVESETGLTDFDLIEETENEIFIQAEAVLSGAAVVNIQSSHFQFMSVYLRRVQGTDEQLVGRVSGKNVTYSINTRDFPNGYYELSVREASNFDAVESNSLQVRIENETEPITQAEPTQTPILNEERPVLQITPQVLGTIVSGDEIQILEVTEYVSQEELPRDDQYSEPEEENEIAPIAYQNNEELLNEPIRQRALEKLEADTATLDDLFTRYAAAVQSGDPDMIREARNAIDSYQRSIVDSALSSPVDRFIADDLSRSLDEEIQQITAKVETFESLRRDRSEGEASKDSDGDGIADIDERILFGTDPLRADTDGDGFTDGAEIIRGFNPVDAASEAVIVYKSPKETIGIAANKNLQVVDVAPDINLATEDGDAPVVQTTVRGKALPNSFVTLYVFSTPTIVTVKTDADGSFEYTFSKELEDGEHQVFVALTDNTGDIVAQSEPFTFIKQAEAFTAVDAEAVVSNEQAPGLVTGGASSFQTVLAMSVLALGILLIMLGVGLRSNRPEQTQIEAAT